jgi:hypothetical protein
VCAKEEEEEEEGLRSMYGRVRRCGKISRDHGAGVGDAWRGETLCVGEA